MSILEPEIDIKMVSLKVHGLATPICVCCFIS